MGNPKLTKAIRAEMVDSIIASTYIPAKKQAILDSTAIACREAVRALLPAGFERATATLPREWFCRVSDVAPTAGVNPRSILESPEGTNYYCHRPIHFDPVPVPNNVNVGLICQVQSKEDPTQPCWANILSAQIKEATKLRAEEDQLRAEVLGFLNSCASYNAVTEKFPAFARHLPKPSAPPMPLVVSVAPLQNKLHKLGFDLHAPKDSLPAE